MVLSIFFLAFIGQFFGQNQEKTNIPERVHLDSDSLIGLWGIAFTFNDSLNSESRCNVCPCLIFESDGNGEQTMSAKVTNKFTWKIENGFLAVALSGPNNSIVYSSTTYTYKISTAKNYIELRI